MTIITEDHPLWPVYSRLPKCGEITASEDGDLFGLNCSRCPTIFRCIVDFLKHQQKQHTDEQCFPQVDHQQLQQKAKQQTTPKSRHTKRRRTSISSSQVNSPENSRASSPAHSVAATPHKIGVLNIERLTASDEPDEVADTCIKQETDLEAVYIEEVGIVNEAMDEEPGVPEFCTETEDDEMASNSKQISDPSQRPPNLKYLNNYLNVQMSNEKSLSQLKDSTPLIDKIQRKCEQIEAKIDAQQPILTRICSFMEDMQRYMPSDASLMPSTSLNLNRSAENFENFEKMTKIETDLELAQLEAKLADPAFAAKFLHYFQTIYALNGKREGTHYFKTVMRKLITPNVLLPYSWMGVSRNKNTRHNLSFKHTFPNFIGFVFRVVNAADLNFKPEHNEAAFNEYLRQKYGLFRRYKCKHGYPTGFFTSTTTTATATVSPTAAVDG